MVNVFSMGLFICVAYSLRLTTRADAPSGHSEEPAKTELLGNTFRLAVNSGKYFQFEFVSFRTIAHSGTSYFISTRDCLAAASILMGISQITLPVLQMPLAGSP